MLQSHNVRAPPQRLRISYKEVVWRMRGSHVAQPQSDKRSLYTGVHRSPLAPLSPLTTTVTLMAPRRKTGKAKQSDLELPGGALQTTFQIEGQFCFNF